MHKKAVMLIVLACALTFGNAVKNGFVGDDSVVLVRNDFYKSWGNFPALFQKKYVTAGDDVFNAEDKVSSSGSVAYRPVLSATFFVDYGFWKLTPWGYHLTNIVLHLADAVLVYFIIWMILHSGGTALLAALLFCVHPLKAEAVSAIGYRADVLSTFFALSAFLCYLVYRKGGPARLMSFAPAHVFYFLGVFSKESVFVLPLLIAGYDALIGQERVSVIFRNFLSRYAGFLLIAIFYLYVYFFVFPNKALGTAGLLGGNLSAHAAASLQILGIYLTNFALPFTTKVLPPRYIPPLDYLGVITATASAGLVVMFFVLWMKLVRKNRKAAFFLFWFALAYAPVSGLVPLVHPMGYRFMYFPSVGLLAGLAMLLDDLCRRIAARYPKEKRAHFAVKGGMVGLCMILTISLNSAWRDNVVMAKHMIRDFPKDPAGYFYLGDMFFSAGECETAKELLTLAMALGMEDPRALTMTGICWGNDFEKANAYFLKSVNTFSFYALAYVGIGRYYLYQKDFDNAALWLERALSLAGQYPGYGYLMQTYLLNGQADKAGEVLEAARTTIKNPWRLRDLEGLMTAEESRLPKDHGVFLHGQIAADLEGGQVP